MTMHHQAHFDRSYHILFLSLFGYLNIILQYEDECMFTQARARIVCRDTIVDKNHNYTLSLAYSIL